MKGKLIKHKTIGLFGSLLLCCFLVLSVLPTGAEASGITEYQGHEIIEELHEIAHELEHVEENIRYVFYVLVGIFLVLAGQLAVQYKAYKAKTK